MLGRHPQWAQASAELRRRVTRRFGGVDETAVSELEGIAMSRALPALSAEFLLRLYDAVLQAREDAEGPQDRDDHE